MIYKIIFLTFLATACSQAPRALETRSQHIYEMGSQEGVEMLQMSKLIFTFEPNSAQLKSDDKKQLDALITEIKQNQNKLRRIQIVGHSDQTGSEDINLDVSKERALVVRNALKEAGVKRSKIGTSWLAATEPLIDDQKDAGINRRVEIQIFRIK